MCFLGRERGPGSARTRMKSVGSRQRSSLDGRHVLILNWRDGRHPEAGGSEVYVEHMAAGLVDRGAIVTMIVPRYAGSSRSETVDGIHYRRYGGRLSIYLIVPILAFLRLLPRHDVAIEVQNGVPFLASAYLRVPVLVLVHHVHREQWPVLFSPPVAQFGWWLESRVAPAVGRSSQYVTVSQCTRRELVGLGVDDDRIMVVHNGSPHWGDLVAAERSEQPSLVVLGRLVPHKRVELAIDAVHRLAREFPDLRLDIVGEGWWHRHLTTHVDDLGVGDRVHFHGHVSDEEKHALLARAWVSAVPSLKEGWGLVIVEAGLHQTPSVAFREAGGVQESLLDGVTGRLVDDAGEFTATLGALLRDDELRAELGIAAEKHARSFTWEASQEKFGGLVAGLLDAAARSAAEPLPAAA